MNRNNKKYYQINNYNNNIIKKIIKNQMKINNYATQKKQFKMKLSLI